MIKNSKEDVAKRFNSIKGALSVPEHIRNMIYSAIAVDIKNEYGKADMTLNHFEVHVEKETITFIVSLYGPLMKESYKKYYKKVHL